MAIWEYEYLTVSYDVKGPEIKKLGETSLKGIRRPIISYLNMMGKRGWEVIAVLGGARPEVIILKREI